MGIFSSRAIRLPNYHDYSCEVVRSPNLGIRDFVRANQQTRKRALVSYLTAAVYDFSQGHSTQRFSNDGIAVSWATALADLGYSVDIVNWDDREFTIDSDYDLLVYHGAVNFDVLKKYWRHFETTIYFASGSYWKFHNQSEDNRLDAFEKRHGVRLPRDRYIDFPEEEPNRLADAIIALGNQDTADTFSSFSNVYNLPIGCYSDKKISLAPSDLEKNRHNFLFFSGAGNMHKGLDLLIEAFSKTPQHTLHICTFMDKEFASFYKAELKLPNIVTHGFVDLRSEAFYDITSTCNYIIFPSCSEGSPGSVVECMQQGLIPIVTKGSHIDIANSGIVLSSVNPKDIAQAIATISSESARRLQRRSEAARDIVKSNHSAATFQRNLAKYVQTVTRGAGK